MIWTDPPFRANVLGGYVQSGPERISFSGSTVVLWRTLLATSPTHPKLEKSLRAPICKLIIGYPMHCEKLRLHLSPAQDSWHYFQHMLQKLYFHIYNDIHI